MTAHEKPFILDEFREILIRHESSEPFFPPSATQTLRTLTKKGFWIESDKKNKNDIFKHFENSNNIIKNNYDKIKIERAEIYEKILKILDKPIDIEAYNTEEEEEEKKNDIIEKKDEKNILLKKDEEKNILQKKDEEKNILQKIIDIKYLIKIKDFDDEYLSLEDEKKIIYNQINENYQIISSLLAENTDLCIGRDELDEERNSLFKERDEQKGENFHVREQLKDLRCKVQLLKQSIERAEGDQHDVQEQLVQSKVSLGSNKLREDNLEQLVKLYTKRLQAINPSLIVHDDSEIFNTQEDAIIEKSRKQADDHRCSKDQKSSMKGISKFLYRQFAPPAHHGCQDNPHHPNSSPPLRAPTPPAIIVDGPSDGSSISNVVNDNSVADTQDNTSPKA
eukprot:GHVL01020405.1.p1 GENE.GHVL01020405.1~~GHVL01020405.1.p1  ORF type:complete len:407 (-),score=124.92 GHVL01020405.1:962-2143(-)